MPSPRPLITDISGACNLTCPSCPRGRRDPGGPKGLMSFDLWRSVVEKAKREFPIELIGFNNWGEPTLNPNLPKMLNYCVENNIKCQISTNLQVMTGLEEALAANVDTIWVSTGGFSQETYAMTHQGSFETLLNNLKSLATLKRLLGSKSLLVLKWHRYRHNCHEERLARAFALEQGYLFEPNVAWYLPIQKLLDGPHGAIASLLLVPIEQGLRLAKRRKSNSCSEWTPVLVDAQGLARLCCLTYDMPVGDFVGTPLHELDERRHSHKYCSICLQSGALAYLQKTSARLLLVAARNATTYDVKARLFAEAIVMGLAHLFGWLRLPYAVKRQFALFLKRSL